MEDVDDLYTLYKPKNEVDCIKQHSRDKPDSFLKQYRADSKVSLVRHPGYSLELNTSVPRYQTQFQQPIWQKNTLVYSGDDKPACKQYNKAVR